MNYYKYLKTVGFRQRAKSEPIVEWNDPDLPNKDRYYVVTYREIDPEVINYRHILSWEYRINEDLSIWINTQKMTSYYAWLIDKKAKDKYNMVQILILGQYNSRLGDMEGHVFKHILNRLPTPYEHISASLQRQTMLDKLFK